jgi:hypothetical protein
MQRHATPQMNRSGQITAGRKEHLPTAVFSAKIDRLLNSSGVGLRSVSDSPLIADVDLSASELTSEKARHSQAADRAFPTEHKTAKVRPQKISSIELIEGGSNTCPIPKPMPAIVSLRVAEEEETLDVDQASTVRWHK